MKSCKKSYKDSSVLLDMKQNRLVI